MILKDQPKPALPYFFLEAMAKAMEKIIIIVIRSGYGESVERYHQNILRIILK
jgi:hypothetical protein